LHSYALCDEIATTIAFINHSCFIGASKTMSNSPNFLEEEYAIDTPESVTFAYEVAGIGNRFIAALVDSIIIFVTLILLNILVLVGLDLLGDLSGPVASEEEAISWMGGLIIALYALLNFLIFWGYYVLFEYLWNGQTPGKRLVKVRVLRVDGNPAGFIEVAIRNLVRVVDFLPSGYGLGLLIMFFNKQARRLGDFAAGTLVIKERSDVDLRSLIVPALRPVTTPTTAADESLLLRYTNIRRLTAGDYELIQETLNRRRNSRVTSDVVARLARVIAAKLEVDPPRAPDAPAFLQEVLATYRQLDLS
jgi:uncharacterized RDD family membrane protein YckC